MAPTALLSVSDKQGLEALAAGLLRQGYELLSSGGTAAALAAADLPVTRGGGPYRSSGNPRRPGENPPSPHSWGNPGPPG